MEQPKNTLEKEKNLSERKERIFEVIREEIEHIPEIEIARLYGSWLNREESIDLDVGVFIPSEQGVVDSVLYDTLRQLRHGLMARTEQDVDLVPHTSDELEDFRSPLYHPRYNPSLVSGKDLKGNLNIRPAYELNQSFDFGDLAVNVLLDNRTICRRQLVRSLRPEEGRIFVSKLHFRIQSILHRTTPMIDLHTHSYFSDGQDSYEELMQKAKKLRLSSFSVADHNYLWPQAQEYVEKTDIAFIPGVEISCVDSDTKQTLHLLGYSLHFDIEKLNRALEPIVAGYNDRAKRIILLVNERFGTHLVFEQMLDGGPAVFVSRNAIADALVDAKIIPSMAEAVRAAFVPGENNDWMPNAGDAIRLVRECGGVAVLAHPGNLFSKLDVPELLERLSGAGLAGVEAYYPKHDTEKTETILALARQHNLFVTGGSDWHGDRYSHAPMGIDAPIDISSILKNNP